MPNDYVNKANISGTEYDIRDARIPATTSKDADKYLHVNAETGAFEFAEAQGGGDSHKIYDFSDNGDATFEDLITEIGWDGSSRYQEYCEILYYAMGSVKTTGYGKLTLQDQGQVVFGFEANELDGSKLNKWSGRFSSSQLAENKLGSWFPAKNNPYKMMQPIFDPYPTNLHIALGDLANGYIIPPSETEGKTYVLKIVNGAFEWVEETAGE